MVLDDKEKVTVCKWFRNDVLNLLVNEARSNMAIVHGAGRGILCSTEHPSSFRYSCT